jgi:hypothetical protein
MRDDLKQTIPEMERAAKERLDDALAAYIEKQFHGCLYLAGYTAELLLKTAYGRFSRIGLTTALWSMIRPAQNDFNRLAGQHSPNDVVTRIGRYFDSGHSIEFWGKLLIFERIDQGLPLTDHLETRLRRALSQLHACWSIQARYRAGLVTRHQAEQVYDESAWILNHHPQLWS